MKASWMTVNEVMKVIEAKPGMTMVQHTFGSDMKYHIHTHSLVTFGGLNKDGNWIYPKDKYVIKKANIGKDQNTINLAQFPSGMLIFVVGDQRYKVLKE